MKSTKTKMIIIIAAIVLVAIIGFVLMLTLTKPKHIESKQEELWGYVFSGNVKSIFNSYFEGENYYEILKDKKYENTTNITFEGNVHNKEKIAEYLKNLEVIIDSKIDNQTNQINGSAKIEYLKNEIFKIDFIKDNQSYGIKSDEVVDRYLGIRNKDLDLLAEKFNVNLNLKEIIPISYTELFPSEQAVDMLVNDIKEGITEQISVDRFTKQAKRTTTLESEEIVTDSYTITLNDEEVYNLEKGILEKIANDTTLQDELNRKAKLMGDSASALDAQRIQSYIEQLRPENITHEQKMIATIYILENKMVKFETTINLNNNQSVQLIYEIIEEKNKLKLTINYNETTYEFSIDKAEENTVTINIKAGEFGNYIIKSKLIEGSLESGEVTNRVGISAKWEEQGDNFAVVMTNKIKLVEELELENLSGSNCAFVNDMSQNEIMNLYTAISDRIKNLYKEKMDLIDSGALQQQYRPVNNEITEFNKQFEMYEGEFDGTIVIELLNKIIKNNTQSDYMIDLETKLTDKDETKLKAANITVEKVQPLANLLDASAVYKITIEHQPVSGAVNGVKIVKKGLEDEPEDNRQVTINEDTNTSANN